MRFIIFFFIALPIFSMNAQDVGIGTTNPSDALHVEAGANKNALRVRIDGQTKLRVYANGGVAVGQNNASGTPANGLFINGNTGLGASSPEERLVVDGNVDVMGEIKADGIAGEEGQFLTPDGNGNMVWENLSDCRFTDGKHFPLAGTTTWIVPADVTFIKVEAWGAGGTGGPVGGGGGGGYACAYLETVPGESYTIEVGDASAANNSTEFYLTSNPISLIVARAGTSANTFVPGSGGTFSIVTSKFGFGQIGEGGSPTTVSYSQKSSTEFIEATQYGRGGASGNGFGSSGAFILRDADSGAKLLDNPGRVGSEGSGGPGDDLTAFGRDGYMIIRW